MAARLTTYLVVAIVAGSVIAGLIGRAQRDDPDGPVDLIVHNANVYTADGNRAFAEAVAIRGNQILRVGSNREITRLRRPQTTMIDANGGAVLPGFNDANVQLIEGALQLGWVDLTGVASIDEAQSRIAAWARSHPDAAWVLGRGWTPATFGRAAPTRQLLDAVVKDRPAAMLSADGGHVWVNSKALESAGVTRRTPSPEAGEIVRDARGEPAGVLEDAATALVTKQFPAPTRAQREEALRAAIAEAHRLGITSVHDVGATLDDIALYSGLQKAGDLDLRVYAALQLLHPLGDALLAELAAIRTRLADDPLLKAGAVALELGDEQDGEVSIDADALNRFVRLLDAQGWQVLTDAQHAEAVRMALDAYLHAGRSNGAAERGRRHRIEGAVTVGADDVPRFEALGVLASVRPPLTPIEPLAAGAARLVLGSGWPHAALDPLSTLQDTAGRLPLPDAVDALTSNAAFASYDEQRKGTLASGMLADLVVLSTDIFDGPAALAAATVAVTVFDGKVVYRRDVKSTN